MCGNKTEWWEVLEELEDDDFVIVVEDESIFEKIWNWIKNLFKRS